MKILFDQGTPAPLRHHLDGHHVETVHEADGPNWKNGDLLKNAEDAGYDVLITTADQNLKYQQNLTDRTIAIIVLKSTSWPLIQNAITDITAVNASSLGAYQRSIFASRMP
ncbi:MAG: hypothetical protein R3B91_00375 [Planctomycetaceae bacterium]